MYHLYSWPLALPAILLLCIDLIGEMFPLSALSFDPADPEISHQYPRDIHKHILTTSVMIDLIVSGLVMGML